MSGVPAACPPLRGALLNPRKMSDAWARGRPGFEGLDRGRGLPARRGDRGRARPFARKPAGRYSPASAAISRARGRLFVSPSSWVRPSIIFREPHRHRACRRVVTRGMFLTTPGEADPRAPILLFILGAGSFSTPRAEFLERLLETTPKLAGHRCTRSVICGRAGRQRRGRARRASRSRRSPSRRRGSRRSSPRCARASPAGRSVRRRFRRSPRRDRRDASAGEVRRRDLVVGRSRAARGRDACRAGARSQCSGRGFSCLPLGGEDDAAGVGHGLDLAHGLSVECSALRAARPSTTPGASMRRASRGAGRPISRCGSRPIGAHWPRMGSGCAGDRADAARRTPDRPRALIEIEVGTPGVDHDTIDLSRATGGLAFRAAAARSETPSVAEIVGRHLRRLRRRGEGAQVIRLAGGRVIDPAHGRDEIADLWIDNGRIIAPPAGRRAAQTFDLAGKIVMAGAIDIHSHIAGANVNTARLLLPEYHRAHLRRPAGTPLTELGWSTMRDRKALCGHGLHHGRRTGDRAAYRAARPSRARRHPDHRQGHSCRARQ